MLKRIASWLPPSTQQQLKRLHFAWLIRQGTFTTAEDYDTEFPRLQEWVKAGDCVLDLGANVGNYTARLSQIVGPSGRVIAFEPVPETFELLVANIARFPGRNVTLLNAAASDAVALQGMAMPMLDSGLANRYMAHVTEQGGDFQILCLPVDHLQLTMPVRLVKIDVEGHELQALRGMEQLLRRWRPRLIVEGRDDAVAAFLANLGYGFDERSGSPNRVFTAATPGA